MSRAIITVLLSWSLLTPALCQESISREELIEWVSYLSSDDMKGRLNGSPEMEVAAGWIAEKFRAAGLKPLFPDGEYISNYTFSSRGMTVSERNVAGVLPGADPELADEIILVTAHFDHVGTRSGVEGDSIYNGADDNAAGTITVISVAEAIRRSGVAPGRTIVFAAFSGEEMGIRGSRHMASNPPFSLDKVYACINFEMTGHSEELGKGNYYMTGCSFSNLDDLLAEFNEGGQVQLIDTIPLADRLFYMSDNIAFARISESDGVVTGIPGGTFATSTLAPHIHQPGDEASLFDFDNMTLLVNYFDDMVLWLSRSGEKVEWTSDRFRRLK